MGRGRSLLVLALLIGGALAAASCVYSAWPHERDVRSPTPDPLATPVMPEFPTRVDVGRQLYYYHCMPCHGHQGQGLTDEWRQTWPEDHQDCWARGCHTGRAGEEGFAIPRTVPAISGAPGALADFRTPDSLFSFLVANHPPQRPGALSDQEYWALTAYVLHENRPEAANGRLGLLQGLPVAIIAGLLIAGLLALKKDVAV